jgi:hypothetical protein
MDDRRSHGQLTIAQRSSNGRCRCLRHELVRVLCFVSFLPVTCIVRTSCGFRRMVAAAWVQSRCATFIANVPTKPGHGSRARCFRRRVHVIGTLQTFGPLAKRRSRRRTSYARSAVSRSTPAYRT